MLKKLKNLLTNSTKLENNPKLRQKIKTYLKNLKNSSKTLSRTGKSTTSGKTSRGARNMKITPKTSKTTKDKTKKDMDKASAKKRLLILLSAAKKKLQDERKARMTTSAGVPPTRHRLTPPPPPVRHRQLGIPPPLPPKSKVNYESHPIWDYFVKLQNSASTHLSSANRARKIRRLF